MRSKHKAKIGARNDLNESHEYKYCKGSYQKLKVKLERQKIRMERILSKEPKVISLMDRDVWHMNPQIKVDNSFWNQCPQMVLQIYETNSLSCESVPTLELLVLPLSSIPPKMLCIRE